MKKLLFVVFFWMIDSALACEGDCMKCHPVLKESITQAHHKILVSCVQCHSKINDPSSECGQDCFACHDKDKLIKSDLYEHQQIQNCKQCHFQKDVIFEGLNQPSNLVDILNQK